MADDDKTSIQQVAQTTTTPSVVQTSVKPGWKTTEFLGLAVTLVIAAAQAVQALVAQGPPDAAAPTPWAILAAGFYGAFYAYSRAKVKTAGQNTGTN